MSESNRSGISQRRAISAPQVLSFCLAVLLLAVSCANGDKPPGSNDPPPTQVTVTFDFDSGTPSVIVSQNIPFSQTVGGVTVEFSSPSGAAYSVQNQDTTFFILSQFSGQYLYDNDVFRSALQIKFSSQLTSVTINFATVDSHGPGNVETPTFIKLTAFLDSVTSTAIGTATANGVFSEDTYPQGLLTFNSSTVFNIIVIELPPVPQGASTFLIDSIIVTTI